MAKILCSILVLLNFSTVRASVDALVNYLTKTPQEISCMASDEVTWNRDSEAFGNQNYDCPEDWSEHQFYTTAAHRLCSDRYGKTAHTCSESDQAKIIDRISNEKLMNEISSFAVTRFSEYKTQLIDQCCQDKKQCRKRFSNVSLILTPGLEVDASYNSDSSPEGRNTISVSKGKLGAMMNKESIERVLLHELGHACQFALISEDKAKYKTFTEDPCAVDSGRLMFDKEGLGEEMANCLDKELQSQIVVIPEGERGKFCFGKWYREAFADMRFRQEYKSIYHWTYDFYRRSPYRNYASVYKYIGCGMTPEIKSQFCKPRAVNKSP